MTYADAYNLRTGSVSFNNVADAIDGTLSRQWGGTSTGAANTYAVTCSPAWAAYESGRALAFVPNVSNTGATTINVNGLGAQTVRYKNRALVGGELVSGVEALLVYDGSIFELINHGGGWANWTPTYGAGGSMTFTSVTTHFARYKNEGQEVRFFMYASGTTGGTASNFVTFTLPIAPSSANFAFSANIVDPTFSGDVSLGQAFLVTGSTVYVWNRSQTNWGLGTARSIFVQGHYQVT